VTAYDPPVTDTQAVSDPPSRTGRSASTGPFFFGLLILTSVSFWGFRGFANNFCGSFLSDDDTLALLSALVGGADSRGAVGESSTWALNQAAMCLNTGILTGRSAGFPPTVVLALASMLAGLAGGLAAVACRVWPPSVHAAPQLIGDVAAGLSVGLAVVALAGLLDSYEAGKVILVFAGGFILLTWIVQQSALWLRQLLTSLLIIGASSAAVALAWPSSTAREGAIAVCGVLVLVAVAAIGLPVKPISQGTTAEHADDQDRDLSGV
jgi:hypothetical protein